MDNDNNSSKRFFLNSCIAIMLIAMLVLFSAILSPIIRAIPADGFGLSIHKEITKNALGFLKPDILEKINSGHTSSDVNPIHQLSSSYHFDGCNFEGATYHINNLYMETASSDPDPKNFGIILHAVMDFYAHSNWVEMGRNDILDDETGLFRNMYPLEPIKGGEVLVIQGEDDDVRKKGLTLSRAFGSKLVYATEGRPNGLITGTVPYAPDDCPDSIALGHWDLLGEKGLNKDEPGREGHEKAAELATTQTLHEWCRLVYLVEQAQGVEGKKKLFDTWVTDWGKAREKTDCPPPSWRGEFESRYTATSPDSGLIAEGIETGEFSFEILNDNSITGDGTGYLADTPTYAENGLPREEGQCLSHVATEISFSVEGNYDPKTGKALLQFSLFTYPETVMCMDENGEVNSSAQQNSNKHGLLKFLTSVSTDGNFADLEIDLKDGTTMQRDLAPGDTSQYGNPYAEPSFSKVTINMDL